jgi:hypothetical protein
MVLRLVIIVARSRTLPPANTSSIRSRTRSQPELTVDGQVEHRKIALGGQSGHFRDLDRIDTFARSQFTMSGDDSPG